MLTGALVALGCWGTIPLGPALGLALVWQTPLVAAPVLLAAATKAILTRRDDLRPARLAGWLRTAAAELRGGGSLRSSVVAATEAYGGLGLEGAARLAAAGRSMAEVGAELGKVNGLEAAAVVLEVTGSTGGSVAPILEALAADASDEAGLIAERRSLTVAARWSIGLVGGFPLLVLAIQTARGEIGRMLRSGPVSAALVGVGIGLLVAGMTVVAVLMKRARQ